MFSVELCFEVYRDTSMGDVERAINACLDCLRYSGQIIGRELPVVMDGGQFTAKVICPEQDSLSPKHHSPQVQRAMNQLADAGLLQPRVKVMGQDMNSDLTAPEQSSWHLLYTTHLHVCSPIRCGETFLPVPLYRLPAVANGDQKQLIKWQEDWSACDQLQMNGSILEHAALKEMGEPGTRLFRRGWDLCRRLQVVSKIPTYLYLYRVGGESLAEEQQRRCPVCDGDWALDEPIHDIFDFKCDQCQLVSNISWDFKK
ncbi:hypothetical protein VST7929_02161 [Vibrio stylophorae]|uniref:Zn-ribbon-containing protein n=1 Tax=Vibrio stylophorae TaxID=659351 RepID=A0ABM8ZVB0_9VIBR|nr:Zn-ribbon-containing protein [Vibrio stylophorae]CAH0534246.1 hypothetical protein VST7929_02161 [Vibrio stylophorae]